GHDLPSVTVAGVLDADGPLGHADFRAEERAFSLIVQAVGRAGRRGEAARAFVQAYRPAARAVDLGVRGAVEEFLAGEIAQRERLGFPPFGHLARLVVEGEDEGAVASLSRAVAAAVAEADDVRVLGPARLHRLRGRYRRAVVARADRAADAAGSLAAALAEREGSAEAAGLRTIIDVDPQVA
ncbi:MAG: primosomal protein N', partial [Miltoncostaeaceae bacterium]